MEITVGKWNTANQGEAIVSSTNQYGAAVGWCGVFPMIWSPDGMCQNCDADIRGFDLTTPITIPIPIPIGQAAG